MKPGITIALPTIPPRTQPGGLLWETIDTIRQQTRPPEGGISVALDVDHAGAATTRQRALDAVTTQWVAFVDDDDLLYPHHLQTLHDLATDQGADYVWSWFDGNNPFPMHRGRQMNPQDPHHTTMTVMVRTGLAREVGFINHPDANPDWPGEDWRFITGCVQAGARFATTPDITWHYRSHGGNTSGLGTRW